MKSTSLLKLALISASLFSGAVVSIKIVEVHFHFGPSTAIAAPTPVFKVDKNQEFEDHWRVELPNDGGWHDTSMALPANRKYLSIRRGNSEEDLTGLKVKIGDTEYVIKSPSGAKPISGFHVAIIENYRGKSIQLKNEREGVNNPFKIAVSFVDDIDNQPGK